MAVKKKVAKKKVAKKVAKKKVAKKAAKKTVKRVAKPKKPSQTAVMTAMKKIRNLEDKIMDLEAEIDAQMDIIDAYFG